MKVYVVKLWLVEAQNTGNAGKIEANKRSTYIDFQMQVAFKLIATHSIGTIYNRSDRQREHKQCWLLDLSRSGS